jgi:hypothetical protein
MGAKLRLPGLPHSVKGSHLLIASSCLSSRSIFLLRWVLLVSCSGIGGCGVSQQVASTGSVSPHSVVAEAFASCGRVRGTQQQYSVLAHVRRKSATAAFITAAFGVAGTLATTIVGATTKSPAATGTTGAGAVALTGTGAALAAFLESAEDAKADSARIDSIKVEAERYYEELDKLCGENAASPGCDVRAAGIRAKCDALANSLPFAP